MNWNEYFYYDETSPTCLRWKVDRHSGRSYKTVKIRAGSVAGSNVFKNEVPRGSRVMFNWKTLGVHRIIWEMQVGPIPKGKVIDHLDGNPHNNKLENLACKTLGENSRNKKQQHNNTSGVTGVSYMQNGVGNRYVMASCRNLDGTPRVKCFSIDKLGETLAFEMAVAHRKVMIEELNAQGAGYTERNGTKNKGTNAI